MEQQRGTQEDIIAISIANFLVLRPEADAALFKRIKRIINQLSLSTDGSLCINHGAWGKHRVDEIFPFINEILMDSGLRMNDNKQVSIPKHLAGINMPYLKILHLQNNLIESIEAITTINLPELTNLIIYGNRIVSIKSLRRAYWPAIKVINLANNRIPELGYLTEMKAPILTSVSIEWQPDPATCTNCSWVLKLQTIQLESLWIRSRKRMWQERIYTSMEAKHRKKEQITIYVAEVPNQG